MNGRSEPVAMISGPYGKAIPLFASPERPEEYFHDLDGVLDMAGIHDPADRSRCRKALGKGDGKSIKVQVLFDHGGRKVPKVLLPATATSAYRQIPPDAKVREVAENWVTLALDQPDWPTRAAALLDVMQHATEDARSWTMAAHDGFEIVHAFGQSVLITAALEHLHEPEIDCLEAAAFYALTLDDGWSEAGIEWLRPFRKTWFKDWIAERPVYREWASTLRKTNDDLPAWLANGGAA